MTMLAHGFSDQDLTACIVEDMGMPPMLTNDVGTPPPVVEITNKRASAPARKPSSICRHWERGFCSRGVTCGFLHTGPTCSERMTESGEIKAVLKFDALCKDFAAGRCNRGDCCKFSHVGNRPIAVTPLCRDWIGGTCNRGDQCKYKHESVPSAASTPPTPAMQPQSRMMQQMVLQPVQMASGTAVPFLTQSPSTPVWIVDSPQTVMFQPQSHAMFAPLQLAPDRQAYTTQVLAAEQNVVMLRARADAAEHQLASLRSGDIMGNHTGTDSPISMDSHPTTFTSDGTPQATSLDALGPVYASRVTLMTHQPYA
eukprot:TRINITY_DN12714_c0_g1_i1.p1 TRINITY_DN12714_c0_g1~~TRINITY_DN12714_c0_g1_i1.p1  ORF type:complete len:312 (+),score=51.64 TRINITY_DN12714_c0_g1_i1:52-987(+)